VPWNTSINGFTVPLPFFTLYLLVTSPFGVFSANSPIFGIQHFGGGSVEVKAMQLEQVEIVRAGFSHRMPFLATNCQCKSTDGAVFSASIVNVWSFTKKKCNYT